MPGTDVDLATGTGPIPPEHRVTAKTYLRAHDQDPASFSLAALQQFGMHAARLARQEGWDEAKVPEDGFTVHTWPRAVWDAVVAGERGEPGPATPRQIGYLMMLALPLGYGSRLLDRLAAPMDQDQAGECIDRLKAETRARGQAAGRRRPGGWHPSDGAY